MRALFVSFTLLAMLLLFGATCAEETKPRPVTADTPSTPPGASADSEPAPQGSQAEKRTPLETAPPNVPEFEPAFPGQTRAAAIRTRTAIEVTTLASGFNKPWAI